jgi:hypothetical protein
MGEWSDKILGPAAGGGSKSKPGSWADKILGPRSGMGDISKRDDVDMVETTSGGKIPVFRQRRPGQTDTGGFFGTLTGDGGKVAPPAGEGEGVGVGVLRTVGANSPDPDVRLRTFAKARGEPLSRFRVTSGGEVVRRGDDGVWYTETPSTLKSTVGAMIKDAPANVASGIASAIPGYGIPAAMAIEAGAEAVERAYARGVLGEKGGKAEAYVVRPAVRGGFAGVAGAAGKLIGKGTVASGNKILRGAGRTGMTGKIVKGAEAVDRTGIAKRTARFESFGLEPGTARVTQSDVLAAVHEEVGGMPGKAGRIMREADERLQGQIVRAATTGKGGMPKFLDRAEADRSGLELVKAARGVKDHLYNLRKQRVQPVYKEAMKEAGEKTGGVIDISPTMTKIEDNLKTAASVKERNLWKSIKADFFKDKKLQTDISQLDSLQKHLTSRISNQADQKKWGTDLVREKMTEVRQWLLDDIGEVTPKYTEATRLWGKYSKAIRRFEGDLAKTIGKKAAESGPEKYSDVVSSLFAKSTSPRTIRNIKARVVNQGGGGTKRWGRIQEGAMSDTISDLQNSLEIPQWKMDNLKAALAPKQFEAVQEFQKALSDIGFVPMAKRAGGAGAAVLDREIGGAAPRVVRRATLSPYIQSRIMSENAVRRAAPRIAEELSTDEGVAKLLRLRQMGDLTEKTTAVLTYLGLQGVGARVVKEDAR